MTPAQIEIIRRDLRDYGVFSLAARNAGVTIGEIKALMARDEDFNAEVSESLQAHADYIYMTALERAVNGSDMLMSKILEAKVDGFSRESRVPASVKNKPTGLVLRTFDAEGKEIGVEDDTPEQEPQEAQPASPAAIEWTRRL
jgi:hypothetical protein